MAITISKNESKRTGRTHLCLDIKHKGYRKKETLRLSYKTKPATALEQKEKKDAWIVAKQVASKRESKLLRGELDVQQEYNTSADFIVFAHEYIRINTGIKEVKNTFRHSTNSPNSRVKRLSPALR